MYDSSSAALASLPEPTLDIVASDEIKKFCVSPYHEKKHIVDRLLATVLFVVFFPLMVFLAVLVKLTSRGPAIYRQVRVGKDGRPYVMYKFRSMVTDSEPDGPVWSCGPNDTRVTPFGHFLRKSHLDELPQLWNVVRGEMALIGPRPERPELVGKLELSVPGYGQRLLVRPGITGLAQINLPPDSSIESVQQKVLLDVEYIKTAGALLDSLVLAVHVSCVSSRYIV